MYLDKLVVNNSTDKYNMTMNCIFNNVVVEAAS
jgi:hypothetical protein